MISCSWKFFYDGVQWVHIAMQYKFKKISTWNNCIVLPSSISIHTVYGGFIQNHRWCKLCEENGSAGLGSKRIWYYN